MNTKMRVNAFAAFGALSSYGFGAQHEAFREQVSSSLNLPANLCVELVFWYRNFGLVDLELQFIGSLINYLCWLFILLYVECVFCYSFPFVGYNVPYHLYLNELLELDI